MFLFQYSVVVRVCDVLVDCGSPNVVWSAPAGVPDQPGRHVSGAAHGQSEGLGLQVRHRRKQYQQSRLLVELAQLPQRQSAPVLQTAPVVKISTTAAACGTGPASSATIGASPTNRFRCENINNRGCLWNWLSFLSDNRRQSYKPLPL